METKAITTEQIWQQIREDWFYLTIKTDPSFVPSWYLSNYVQMGLNVLLAKSGSRIIPVEATGSGQLKVAIAAAGFEHNYSVTKFACTNNYAEKPFPQVAARVDVTVWDNDIIIQRRPYTEAAWEGEIRLLKNSFYSFDCSSEAVQVKNAVADQVAYCQLVAWY